MAHKTTISSQGTYTFPCDEDVSNWVFEESEVEEAELADAFAKVARKNSRNDMIHIFPCILRIIKSESSWTK